MEQTLILDTHSFVKEMAEAGMPQPVAEAFVRNYTKYLFGNLATKQDIAVEIAKLETTLTKEIQASQFKIIGVLGGLMAAFAVIIVAVDKLL